MTRITKAASKAWTQRDELRKRCRELEEALGPFAHYAQMRARQPLKGSGNSVHAIHLGTEFEAEITLEHVNAAYRVLYGLDPE